jgi:hypothetical protein
LLNATARLHPRLSDCRTKHDRAEAERLRKLGVEHGEPAASKSKRVYPNSMAVSKWKRTDWRTR